MPSVCAVDRLGDGFRITRSSGAVVSLTSADLPGTVKSGTIANAQTWVNNWLTSQGFSGASRITSITPLHLDLALCDPAANLTVTNLSSIVSSRTQRA